MPITTHQKLPGIAEVVIDHPPVNALDVAGWFQLATAVTDAGRIPDNRVVILRAEGRGFCAGVDIKEIQSRGDEALIGANRGCFAAFAAVYECEVPVIAAVHGFCLGGGIGIVGQLRHRGGLRRRHLRASRGRPRRPRCGHPPVAVGPPAPDALDGLHGQTGHGRRAPPVRIGAPGGSPRPSWSTTAYEVAADIATKSPTIIRRAKESLNGIDPVDVGGATGSNRGSPTSSTWPAWPTSSGPRSSRSAARTPRR